MPLVHESVQQGLETVLPNVPGLDAIFVTTSDGIDVASVGNTDGKQSQATIHAFCAERGGKIGYGAVKSILCTYEDGVYVHVSFGSLVVTFIGNRGLRSAAVDRVWPSIQKLLEPVKNAVQSTEDEDDDDVE